jgi:uncharacterized repeat protein (TIGR01451 family)
LTSAGLTRPVDLPRANADSDSANGSDIGAFEMQEPPTEFTVTNTNDSGPGSLRQAILDSNATPGTQTINFSINFFSEVDRPVVRTIRPASALPTITDPVIIDGYTQRGASPNTLASGSDAVLLIQLDGTNAGAPANGLTIIGGGSTVRGLALNRFINSGIALQTNGGNVIEGNFIGLNPDGVSADAGNGSVGLFLDSSSNNLIGGTTPAARNVISANDSTGIFLSNNSNTNTIRGNYIGTDAAGTGAVGNSPGAGIGILDSSNNIIGGTETGAANLIAFNNNGGVAVISPNTISTGNAVLSNSIHSNGGLGIDLGTEGVTANDPGDADTGANNLQNFPVITSASATGEGTIVDFTLNSTPNTTFFFETFASSACDPSGHGEGEFFVDRTTPVTTDENGNVSSQVTVAATAGQFITMTATDAAGNTSEFSACRQASVPLPQVDVSLTKSDSPDPVTLGDPLTYTITVNNGPAPSNTPEAQNVVVTDTLPAGVTFNGASSTQGVCTESGGTVTCNVGTLGFAGQATVTINVTPTVAGSLSNTASVTSDNPDADTSNNSATATTVVQTPTSFTVSNTADSGAGSLRQAILDSNNTAGTQTINFLIDGGGVQTITPASPLPDITDTVIIDGYTQPGASPNTLAVGSDAVLLIEIDGSVQGTDLFHLRSDNNVIRGLVINRAPFDGIQLLSANGGNVIEGNFIGTDPTGTIARANNRFGVSLFFLPSANNTIGGTSPAARNVISGNGQGVVIGSAGSTNNIVRGNYIGTTASGAAALPNNVRGIFIGDGATNNVIGGTTVADRNVISGNSGTGVFINGTGITNNDVIGNYIGLNAAGTAALGNFGHGVDVGGGSATGNTILSNLIFANQALGINLDNNGVTPNDAGDPDTGANNLQNFPIITSAVRNGGNTTLQGTFNSTPKRAASVSISSPTPRAIRRATARARDSSARSRSAPTRTATPLSTRRFP